MTDIEQHQQQVDYFNQRYTKIAHHWFKTDERTLLRDHVNDVDRKCRFCGLGNPEVSFKNVAHAVPDFLGNASIISLNECDTCNARFGMELEDHLSKAMMLHRTSC